MPNKYSQTPQAELDLHQHTREQALDAAAAFLEASKQAGHAAVRIIVGRGLHSKNGPVLGGAVRDFLEKEGYQFGNAKISEGSIGAIDVKLRDR